MKILAIDDDPFVRELLPAVFEQVALTDVHTADGGRAALKALAMAPTPFDCLLLDVDMPKMNGIELCKRIRALPAYRDTPILMLTAKTDPSSIENAFAAGANDFIAKPFVLKYVHSRIRIAERLLACSQPQMPQPTDTVTIPGKHPFDLEDKLPLTGVARLILPFSLGNYLTQLERGDLNACEVSCIAMDDPQTLYDHSTSTEFVAALTDLANAISSAVACPHMLMSYQGAGSFICITPTAMLHPWDQIETKLNQQLACAPRLTGTALHAPLTVSVGTPITPNANRTQRVRNTVDRALGRAQMRFATKQAAA